MKIITKKDKGLLALAVLLGVISAVAGAFVSIILQRIVDVAMNGDLSGFQSLVIGIAIYVAGLCVLGFAEALCGKVLLRNVTRNLRLRIFCGVMNKQPMDFYKSNSADYLSAVVNDVKLVEENYLIPLLLSAQMIALFLATLGILCYLSPIVTAILIGFLLLMFLVPAMFGKALQSRQDQYSIKLAGFTAKTKDFLSGFEVIRSFSIGHHIRKQYQQQNQETVKAKFRADRLLAINESTADMVSTLSTIVVVFVAAYMVLKGNITAGTLLALIQLSATFSLPVLMIMQNFPKIKGIKPVLQKLGELCDEELQEASTTSEQKVADAPPVRFSNSLELKEVTFAYEKDSQILNGIDLLIEPGKKYALLGESGCGKTTLTKLLTGYSHSYEGSIQYDGIEVRNMEPIEFSKRIAVIHQNVYLFDTDIYQNICLDETFSEEELQQALRKSGVSKFLGKLENGIHTSVGENGNRLSGGQRQRIAVARALIRKTPILILDEGTSAVDQKTACEIERDLLSQKELTLMTITHHMQEELRAEYDKIIFMDQGEIKQVEELNQ